MALIHEQIPKIMAEIGAVAKSHKNPQQGYPYRAVDDVMAAAQPIFARHGVFSYPKVVNIKHDQVVVGAKQTHMSRAIIEVEYHWIATDGSEIVCSVVGEGMDTGDKATYKAMAGALKYALTQTLCIPTDEPKDPEIDSPGLSDSEPKVTVFEAEAQQSKGTDQW